jgi:O-antigen/teichoic acid export membrane protein
MGPAFDGSVAPFVLLAFAGMIIVSQAASSNVLIACGEHRLVATIWIGEAAANLLLSVVLVRWLSLSGVAIGTLVPLVIGHLTIMLTRACRRVGMPVAACLSETMRPAAIAGAIAAGVCLFLRVRYPPASTAMVVVQAAFVAAVYVVSLATLGFDRRTRIAYGSQVLAAAGALAAIASGRSGRRATKVDPDGLVASSATTPP